MREFNADHGEDHPRRCGEHNAMPGKDNAKKGSSPQMRGARAGCNTSTQASRIIPADAGSTLQKTAPMGSAWDHPRRCGEHLSSSGPSGCPWGSSPQMRGALSTGIDKGMPARIIPADAGSTSLPWRNPWRRKDHPRRCGEHWVVELVTVSPGGSSPQMRGARHARRQGEHSTGIIPADAGSTFARHVWIQVIPGSSPQMRGALFL